MVSHPKICCISDIHVGVHQNSNQWHTIALDWAAWLRDDLKSKGVKDIVISGDFFHYRDEIAVNTIHFATEVLNLWKDFNIIMLVGNHDAYYKDRSDVNSLSILAGWGNIRIISEIETHKILDKQVTFCPWGCNVSDIPKSDIIFGHFEIQNFKQNSFKICSTGIKSGDILDKSSLIISGHFHLRDERIYDNGRILYLGNPFQMDFGDIDSTKGYYILDINTLQYDFTENVLSPQHKKIYLSELVTAGKITKRTKDKFNNNFIRFIVDKNVSPDEIDLILQKLYTLNPLSINVDYAANFNKYKLDESIIHDFSGIDIETAINEFVNIIDMENKKEVIDYTIDLYRKCM
jgi:DNA repair exonuclease SbcCD nuclease subunit